MNELDPVFFNLVRGILTLLLMLAFITLTVWLYARKHRHAYDEAARLPLEEDAVADNGSSTAGQSS